MSLRERRARDDDRQRHRALLAMRDNVVSATTTYLSDAGSAVTEEAVDAALVQLIDAGVPDDLEHARQLWIDWAKCRLIDTHRSAEFRYRDPVAVDEHREALERAAAHDDPLALSADSQQWWRLQEIIRTLRGPQRVWMDAWLQEVLSGFLAPGAQPRGLHKSLGWTRENTKKTSHRARGAMVEFIQARASGVVCTERQALLDSFIAATAPGQLRRADADLDQDSYESILLHLAGCEDCFAAWRSHRRTLRTRLGALIMVPLDSLAGAMQAFADRLASLASGAHSATLSLLQRLGLGGAAAIGSKTAAVCVGVVCAAGAGVGEFTGVLPPIRAPDHVRKHAAHTPAATHRFAAATPGAAGRSATPPAPPPAARPATSSLTSLTGNSSAPTTASSTPTPGDLQVSTSTRTQTSTPSSQTSSFATGEATSTPATSGAESCVPGSLGC